MLAGTNGRSYTNKNICGINQHHSFSVLSSFYLREINGEI